MSIHGPEDGVLKLSIAADFLSFMGLKGMTRSE
jgi:hypothetical protein